MTTSKTTTVTLVIADPWFRAYIGVRADGWISCSGETVYHPGVCALAEATHPANAQTAWTFIDMCCKLLAAKARREWINLRG